jgi:4-aminobutyrate aminotransferase-like enzyme
LNTLNLHEKKISSTEHWSSLLSHYGKLLSNEQQKNKNEKQLDVFEWSLYRYNYKRQYDQKFYMNDSCKLALDQYGAALRLNEEIVSMVRMVVVERQYCDRGVFESL